MLYLISLNTEFLHPNIPEKDLPEIVWAGRKIRTRATRIIPFKKGVDPALQTLVCACLNYNDDRPSLKDLLLHAENAVTHPAASYRSKPEEQDDAISKFVCRIQTPHRAGIVSARLGVMTPETRTKQANPSLKPGITDLRCYSGRTLCLIHRLNSKNTFYAQ